MIINMVHDIKSVTFDMFNTLIFPKKDFVNYRNLSDMLVENGYEIYPQELEAARQYVFFIDFPKGRINTWESWTKRIFYHLGYPTPSEEIINKFIQFKNEFISGLRLYDDVVPTINQISEMMIPLSIVTTIPEFKFIEVIKPIYDKFDLIVTGGNAGCSKGNPKMYKFDLDQKNIPAINNLFVGDDPYYDIEIPKRMGQTTGLLNRSGDKFKSKYSDFILTSLTDVLNLL